MKTDTKNVLLAPFNLLYKISPELELKLLLLSFSSYLSHFNCTKYEVVSQLLN